MMSSRLPERRAKQALVSLSTLVSLMVSALPASAQQGAVCYPACRQGYLCAPDGRCVSACNPPCESGSQCQAGECVMPPTRAASSSSSARSSSSSASTEGADASPRGRFGVLGGPAVIVSEQSAPAVALSGYAAFGAEHAFVVGPRVLIAFPSEANTFGVVGVDAGYRASFGKGDVTGGLLVLAQPQFYVGGGSALLHLGGAVGGFLRYGAFEMQLPISVGAAWPLKKLFDSSRFNATFVTLSLLAGVSF